MMMTNPRTASARWRFAGSGRAALFLLVLLIVSAPACSAAASITSTSGNVIYVDSASTVTPNLLGNYVSFNITNTGSSIADAWATIGNFSGGFVSLGVNENGIYHIGPLAAGATRTVFFYVNVDCSTV